MNSVTDEFATQYEFFARPAAFGAREYFAAHAPAVPDWFQCESEGRSPEVPSSCCLPPDQRREYFQVKCEEHKGEVSPVVRAFIDHEKEMKQALAAWTREQQPKRFFQWRRYYADMMIQTLQGEERLTAADQWSEEEIAEMIGRRPMTEPFQFNRIHSQADVLRRAPRPEESEVLHNPPHYGDMLPKKDAG